MDAQDRLTAAQQELNNLEKSGADFDVIRAYRNGMQPLKRALEEARMNALQSTIKDNEPADHERSLFNRMFATTDFDRLARIQKRMEDDENAYYNNSLSHRMSNAYDDARYLTQRSARSGYGSIKNGWSAFKNWFNRKFGHVNAVKNVR